MKFKNKIDLLLIAGFTSSLFYSAAYPIIHIVCIKDLNSNLMSLASLLNCIFVILVSKIWLKYSDKLYKTFGISLFLEALLYCILLIAFLINKITPAAYFLIDCLLSAIITRNIISGGNRLKALRYKDRDREEFDNKTILYGNIANVIGYSFSTIFTLNRNLAFILMWVGIVIDNVFYYLVYRNEIKKY